MPIKKEIFRIIDANLNRSREGLRVCEDISRFIMNSPSMTKELKAIRHGISAIIESSGAQGNALLEGRNARDDVGKLPKRAIEVARKNYADIFIANIERVKESLRVLEEFYKLVDIKSSVKLLRLRFRAYEIEKKAVKRLSSLRHTG